MSDWLTFATLFSSGACELCSSSPAGSQSNTVLTLPGLQDRLQEGGFGESSHTPSPSTVSFFSPTFTPPGGFEKSQEEETCIQFASSHLPWGIFPDIVPNSISFLRH